MPDKMDDRKAWELVMGAAEEIANTWAEPEVTGDLRAALAHLRGKHAYFSRFKPGDKVWCLNQNGMIACGEVLSIDCTSHGTYIVGSFDEYELGGFHWPESNCFPTRSEAQAECDRRNKEGE